MATCDTSQLQGCFDCLTAHQKEVLITQWLCEIKNLLESGDPMSNCDANVLDPGFNNLPSGQLLSKQLEILCDVKNALGGGGGGGGGAFVPRVGANVALTTLAYAPNVAIDLDDPAQQIINASGNLTLATANRSDGTKGKFATAIIIPTPGPINITLAAGIKKPDSFQPTIGIGKVAYITFNSTGPDESDTIAVQQIFS